MPVDISLPVSTNDEKRDTGWFARHTSCTLQLLTNDNSQHMCEQYSELVYSISNIKNTRKTTPMNERILKEAKLI